MKMKSLLYLMPLAALVSYLTGCASPKLAQTPLDAQEEEWKASLQASYPSWKPPQTAPEVEEQSTQIDAGATIVDVNEPLVIETLPPPVINKTAANAMEPQSYTVQKGDTLWKIADKFYGDGKKWPLIADANTANLGNPNKLKPGTVITIPPTNNPPLK